MLIDDESLAEKLRGASSDFITEKYSWNDVADATYRLYLGRSSDV